MADDRIEIENFTSPGRTYRVDRAKFEAMRDALLKVLPRADPGLTVAAAKTSSRCCRPTSSRAARRRAGG